MDTWEERVRLFARRARDQAGSAEALAGLLEEAGIRSNRTGRRLRANTITQWMRGIAIPPGDTLLAMAKVTNLSLDSLLRSSYQTHGVAVLGEVESRLTESERDLQNAIEELGRLRGAVDQLRDGEGSVADRLSRLESAESEIREFLADRQATMRQRNRPKVASG